MGRTRKEGVTTMKMGPVYSGKRTNGGGAQPVTKDGQVLSHEASQRLWNHSPDGFQWGFSAIMNLDMAVGANKLKPFRMIPYLSQRATAMPFNIPQVFLGFIEVVKMEGGEIAIIPTNGATTSEGHLETFTFLSFLLTKARLLALGAEILPSLIASILEELSTVKTMPLTFQINRGTFMVNSFELSTERASFGSCSGADVILAEKLATLRASDIVVVSHLSPPMGIFPYQCPKFHPKITYNDGPAQLALALLLDVTGDPDVASRLHQQFKEDFVARWGDSWSITHTEILAWVRQHAPERYLVEEVSHEENPHA